MATGAAGDGIFGNVFGGTISTDDMGIQHRPYHRNCTCALHKSNEKNNNSSCHHPHGCSPKVSYPVRRSWSEGCLVAMMTSSQPSPGSSPSPPPAPTGAPRLPPHAPHHR
uniref:uncharacterized protein LOC122593884 n=1 Tax=Erigeron canadensis TaxID=72917 RepID=UPI001CB9407F|nr:uncharacterized protein LOC122593884 [Erigeron canadensis]